MTDAFTENPFAGKKKKIAEALKAKFGYDNIGIKFERGGWYNVFINPPVFMPTHDRDAQELVQTIMQGESNFVGCDVWK